MITRTTTSGTLKTYRYNLQSSTYSMNKSMNTVITRRSFNSFADNPAGAARSFHLRSSYLRTSSQSTINESIVRKFNVAYKAMDSVESALDTDGGNSALFSALRAMNGATASSRRVLGQQCEDLAKSIVQDMNGRYGDNFVFSGADGLNAPFTFDGQTLLYRGVDVNADAATDPDGAKLLEYYSSEKKYMDIGLGYDLSGGKVESSTVFDAALQGVDFLGGYGTDADGDPKNVVAIISRMSVLLKHHTESTGGTRPDGSKYSEGDFDNAEHAAEYERLVGKLEDASIRVKQKYTELSTKSSFLNDNQSQLKANADNLNEQIEALDYVDEAQAISDLIWAKYCYDTALKVGNSVLAQSLMDYLNL